MSPLRVVIFAKAPRSGFAKTRLIPALGADGAADLARLMLIRVVGEALRADIGPVELCVTPSATDAAWPIELRSTAVDWKEQGEGDLGERLMRAATRVIDGGESVLLIGADCPELDAGRLRDAAESLRRYDATLIPAADGGYALLGLKRCDPALFSNMRWSTGTVGEETLRRATNLGWRVKTHSLVHDIDEPADLKWLTPGLARSLQTSPAFSKMRTLTTND